jgi:hypothetical protein
MLFQNQRNILNRMIRLYENETILINLWTDDKEYCQEQTIEDVIVQVGDKIISLYTLDGSQEFNIFVDKFHDLRIDGDFEFLVDENIKPEIHMVFDYLGMKCSIINI